MPPETIKEIGTTFNSDVWAIGCVLYELCFLKKAFDSNK
jgi:serine/threonine protein kinase